MKQNEVREAIADCGAACEAALLERNVAYILDDVKDVVYWSSRAEHWSGSAFALAARLGQ